MLTIPLSSKMDCCGTSISAGCFFWVCYLQTEKKNMVSCAIPSVKCPFTCLFVFFFGGGGASINIRIWVVELWEILKL